MQVEPYTKIETSTENNMNTSPVNGKTNEQPNIATNTNASPTRCIKEEPEKATDTSSKIGKGQN